MDTIRFLESVLADSGFYSIFAANTKKQKIRQQFFESIEAAYTAALELNAEGYDAYFALGTFQTNNSREAKNVKYMKSMFIDVDCGAGKPIADQREGLKELRKFCKALSLPKPIIVDSGRGLHVYWALTDVVTYAEWLPVAEQFKQKFVELGFKVDPAVSADAARVLRVPDTHNHKPDPPKIVLVLDDELPPPISLREFSDKLGAELRPVSLRVSNQFIDNIGSSAFMDNLMGNTQSRFKTILEKTAAGKGCPQLAVIIRDQADMSEPMWRAGLSIANACVDRDKAARVMSHKHPHYDPDETADKMKRIQGPYLCTRFDEFNPGVCESCPNFGKIKSPIVLGRELAEALTGEVIPAKPADTTAVTETSDLPVGYKRGKTGGIFKFWYVVDEDGSKEEQFELVYPHNIYAVKRTYDPVNDGESIVMRLHLPQDGVREFTMPLAVATSREKLREALSKQGVAANQKGWPLIMDYVTDWVAELQAKLPASRARTQFGWTEDHESFVIGNREYTADNIVDNPASIATAQYFPMFEPKGTLDGWKDMVSFYNQPGLELHQFIIGTAFGSPLMEFIDNVPGALFHIYSKDGGLGKTTAMWVANSVWGNYKQLTVNANDTENFLFNRADMYKNINLCIDELTNEDPRRLSDMIYSITEGLQRGRMSNGVNAERPRGRPWSLIAVSTGNTSIIDRVSAFKDSPLAEIQRAMELRVNKHDFSDVKMTTEELNMLLARNYGHAGPAYIQYLLQNKKQCGTILKDTRAEVADLYKLTEQNRFWLGGASCIFGGLRIANLAGIIQFKVEPILDFFHSAVANARAKQANFTETVADILNNYLADIRGNTLVIENDTHATGVDVYTLPLKDPYQKLFARVEPHADGSSTLYLRKKPLNDWCVERQVDYNGLLDGLAFRLGAKDAKVRMLRGTALGGTPATTALQIELPAPT